MSFRSIHFIRSIRSILPTLLLGCSLTATSLAAQTADAPLNTTEPPEIAFHGFGTLGAVHVDGGGTAIARDLTQPKGANNRGLNWDIDSRLGVQANWQATENLEAVAQIVARYRNANDFRPELTWGFIKYSPNEYIDLRAGRVGFDAFLSADSRDVGYSFLWVRPPIEYYGTLLFPYHDGGDLTLRLPTAEGLTRMKLYTGVTRQHVSSMMNQHEWAGGIHTASIGAVQNLDGSRIDGGLIEYQDTRWTLRYGLARYTVNKEFPSGQLDTRGLLRLAADQALAQGNVTASNTLSAFTRDTQIAGTHSSLKSLAVAYEDGPLQAQAAISRFTGESLLIPNNKSGYASLGYRINQLTPYASWAFIKSRQSHRASELTGHAPDALVQVAQFMLGSPMTNQQTWSLGVRYDLTSNLLLKLQVDRIHNRNCSPVALPVVSNTSPCPPPLLLPTVPVNWNGRANVYTAVIDFIF